MKLQEVLCLGFFPRSYSFIWCTESLSLPAHFTHRTYNKHNKKNAVTKHIQLDRSLHANRQPLIRLFSCSSVQLHLQLHWAFWWDGLNLADQFPCQSSILIHWLKISWTGYKGVPMLIWIVQDLISGDLLWPRPNNRQANQLSWVMKLP